MKSSYIKKYKLTTEHCLAGLNMSPITPFYLFQDLAVEHAQAIGVGYYDMIARGEYWVITNTRIKFLEPAKLMEEIEGETWPEKTGEKDVRMYRSYSLKSGKKVIALGRSEWVILSLKGWPVPFGKTGFPMNFPFKKERAFDDLPSKLADDFTEDDFISEYTVEPTDIDAAHHMNNVKYIPLFMNTFTSEEINDSQVKEVEIHYANMCHEKDKVRIYRKKENNTYRFLIRKSDDKVAAFGSVSF